ncbi:hypothetical protein ABPG74_000825 [Tetrahymena malaccensis]
MKYFKDDCLSKFSAKFNNPKIENAFAEMLYKKRLYLVYTLCFYEIIWQICRIITDGFTIHQGIVILAIVIFLILNKFVPRKYAQYLVMIMQVYSTYSTQDLLANESTNHLQIFFLNGCTQVMYWMVEVQNFVMEGICMQINLTILLIYQKLDNVYILSYIVVCEIIVFYKYSHNINERKLFLALQNFQQWEKMTDKILPNYYIVQKYDTITGQIDVYDCNKIAQKHKIHICQPNYINFLTKMQLDVQFLNTSSRQKVNEVKNLKDYLLEMHSDLYKDQQDKNKSKKVFPIIQPIMIDQERKKKLSEDIEIQSNDLFAENLRVYYQSDPSQKIQTFKVKIVPFYLNINQPLLIICLEDISLFSSFQNLKSQKEFQSDLFNNSFSCLSQKFNNILSQDSTNLKSLQRQILYCKNITQAVSNEDVKMKISKFSLGDLIAKLLKLYSDFNILVFHKNKEQLFIQSEQFYCFKIIQAILSAVNLKNLIKIVTKIKKKSHFEIIKVKFKVKNANQEDCQTVSFEDVSNLNKLEAYNNLNFQSISQLNNLSQTYSQLKPALSCLQYNQSPLLIQKKISNTVSNLNNLNSNFASTIYQDDQDLFFYESQGFSLVNERCNKYIKKFMQKICFKNEIKVTKKPNYSIYSVGIFTNIEDILPDLKKESKRVI